MAREQSLGKVVVVHNASKSPQEVYGFASDLQSHGYEVEVVRTENAGDGALAARKAAGERVAAICAAGGDGTVESVLAEAVSSRTPLAVLPLGDRNRVASDLGIADREAALAALVSGARRFVDTGICELTGTDGETVRRAFLSQLTVEREQPWTRSETWRRVERALGNTAQRVVSLVRACRPMGRVTVNAGGQEWSGPLGALEIRTVLAGGSGLRVSLVPGLSSATIRERRFHHPFADDVDLVSVTGDGGLPVAIGGERVGHTPLKVSLSPCSLKVWAPAAAQAPKSAAA